MLELLDLNKSFNDNDAVKDFRLTAHSGQIVVLIGRSGCGKSTILKLIMHLLEPDSGSIKLNDEEISQKNIESIRQRIGYVIQEGGLFPHLSVKDNITIMAEYLNWPADKIESRLHELAGIMQFSADILQRFPLQLSGGQRQRVSLMRALMLDPDLLLLDEPLGSLDPMIRFDLQQELKDIFRKLNKTVLLVTHDMGEAAFFGDEIVLIRDGRLVQKGSVQDLIKNPAEPFVSAFINAQRSPLDSFPGGIE